MERLRRPWKNAPPSAVEAFRIEPAGDGNFTFAWPLGGEIFHVNSLTPSMTIKWNTFGDEVSKVKIEYWNKDSGASGEWVVIDANVNNPKHGAGEVNENTYVWDTASSEALPVDLAATDVKFRITSSVPDQPSTTKDSNAFVICGDISVTSPSQGDTWLANGSTSNTIGWDVFGPTSNVRIIYSREAKKQFLWI